MSDRVLITWIVCDLLWTVAVWGCGVKIVFQAGHSGWWFLLALLVTGDSTLYKVLKKRYGVDVPKSQEDSAENSS